jgi:hypothetical protein
MLGDQQVLRIFMERAKLPAPLPLCRKKSILLTCDVCKFKCQDQPLHSWLGSNDVDITCKICSQKLVHAYKQFLEKHKLKDTTERRNLFYKLFKVSKI